MERGTSRMLPYLLTVCVGTAVGSVLGVLYPEWALWENAVFRQGMGLTDANFGAFAGCAFLGLAILAILGLSLLGGVGAYLVLLFRGMALGVILSELYRNGFPGFLTVILFVMPYAFGGVLVLLLAAKETCRSAEWIVSCLADRETERFSGKLYLLRYAVLLVLLMMLTAAQYALLRLAYPLFLRAMVKA